MNLIPLTYIQLSKLLDCELDSPIHLIFRLYLVGKLHHHHIGGINMTSDYLIKNIKMSVT